MSHSSLNSCFDLKLFESIPNIPEQVPAEARNSISDIVGFLKEYGLSPQLDYRLILESFSNGDSIRQANDFRSYPNAFTSIRPNTSVSMMFCNTFQNSLASAPSISMVDYL